MRLLLVNCLNLDEGMRVAENSGEHLGILYLASSLRQNFSECDLNIRVSYSLNDSLLDEYKPDIVGLSSVSQNYYVAQRYAQVCKKHGITVMIGGVHISTLPHTLSKDMDVGIMYEGEQTIIDLIQLFLQKKEFLKDNLRTIKGLVFYDNESLVKTERRNPIKNLDSLAFPARELYNHPKRGILTSRGCPYDCTFCFSKPFWGKPRFFSAEYVIKEINEVFEKFKVTKISFYDDLFIADLQRFKKIVLYIRESGLHKKMSFSCTVRPNLVTEEMAILLKSMNVTNVFMGIESGNQRILKYLKKDACSVEQNYAAIKILKKYGIITDAGFIIGSPDETTKEIMDTYRFIRKSGIDFISPLILTPLPGTPIWEFAKIKGFVSDNMDWSILREEFDEMAARHIVLSEKINRNELYRLYMLFKREQKRKIISFGIKHPLKSLSGLWRFLRRQSHYIGILNEKRSENLHV